MLNGDNNSSGFSLSARLKSPLTPPVLAAPLAGWTDQAFRNVLRSCGATDIWVPFISAHAITSSTADRDKYLAEIKAESCHVQIFGNEPSRCGEAARIIQDAGAISIDFNAGCSVRKVHKGGGGSALLKDLKLLAKNLEAVKNAVSIPVSLKTRIGFYKQNDLSGLEACKIAQDLGYSWVTLHARTAKDSFAEPASWDYIKLLVSQLYIPVVGNGDVGSPQDAKKLIDSTSCSGIMIGRAMMGDPWIISDTRNFLTNGALRPERSRREIADVMLYHQSELLRCYGIRKGVLDFRKHMVRYLRGFAGVSSLRRALVVMDDPSDVAGAIQKFGEGKHPIDEWK